MRSRSPTSPPGGVVLMKARTLGARITSSSAVLDLRSSSSTLRQEAPSTTSVSPPSSPSPPSVTTAKLVAQQLSAIHRMAPAKTRWTCPSTSCATSRARVREQSVAAQGGPAERAASPSTMLASDRQAYDLHCSQS